MVGLPGPLFVSPQAGVSTSSYVWDRNSYYGAGPAGLPEFQYGAGAYDFAGWRRATGLDQGSRYEAGRPAGAAVFVRPSRHEAGRAHIIAYNWGLGEAVEADVGGVLAVGDGYEVRNAQDYYGPPVLSGTYGGGPLRLPMTGLSAVAPVGGVAPAPTGPEFNAFVLIRR